MARLEPAKIWWSADELAASGLPEMPGSRQGVNYLANERAWRVHPGCSRKKPGRGGGWQYHWSVLPDSTRKALLMADAPAPAAKQNRGESWATFDALPETVKATARQRLKVIQTVEILQSSGATKVAAVSAATIGTPFKSRTVFSWFQMIEGVEIEDRLPYLAPRHRMAKRSAPKSKHVRMFLDNIKSLYLREEPATFKECFRIALKLAKAEGWDTLTERTAWRRIEREVPRVTRVFLREGVAGLMRCYPAQIRDRSGMQALEGVNADCHKIDIFVRWPDGTVDRPQIVAFQDLYSNKMLSWRVDHNPNKVMVMAAFGEMVETYGIPRDCLFDNGHEFANKWLTAGAKTRFRFKVREDDPLGVLPLLGIKMHWATPAHGQAKPIERGFRDFANNIALDPRFAGAFTGKNPMAKPENYGSRAIPLDKFLQVVDEKVAEHNARQGRLTRVANGRSFDDAFAESYAVAPIRKATEEQRRLWMFGQHVAKLNRDNGSLKFQDNVYHSDWMSQTPSKDIVARFDPEDLHHGLEIYAKDGEYLGFAECQQAVGFFDIAGARDNARRVSKIKKAEKVLAKLHTPIPLSEIGVSLDGLQTTPAISLETKVVPLPSAPARPRIPNRATLDPSIAAMKDADVVPFQFKKPDVEPPQKTSADKFWWAQSVLERSARGDAIGSEEARQIQAYVETAEYLSNLEMFTNFGAEAVR